MTELTDVTIDVGALEEAIRQSVANTITIYPVQSLWASRLDHPCLRYNEYSITRWRDQMKHPVELQELFDKGKEEEKIIKRKLEAAGFELRQSQRPIVEVVRKDGIPLRYKISGKLDVELWHPSLPEGLWLPAEIKSCDPYTWESINTLDDMKNHKRWYIRNYPGQLMTYLYGMSVPIGIFVLGNKISGRLKFVPCRLDLEIMERILQNAEEINRVTALIEKEPDKADEFLSPRIEFDSGVCGRCAFAHICLPEESFSGVNIEMSEEVLAQLDRREVLKSFAKEFDTIDEAVKDKFKAMGDGKYLVGSQYDVIVKTNARKAYDVPPEVKKQYEYEATSTRVDIKPVKR